MEKSKISIWIPVLVAIISGLFSLWLAIISQGRATSVNKDKVQIERLIESSESTLSDLTELNQKYESLRSSIKQLPIGTIVASFLEPLDFYMQMDNRDSFNKDISTWCFANGDENIINTPYYNLRGTGEARIENLQGYFLRGYDESGEIDPNGENRSLGDNQLDTFQGHFHENNATKWYGTHYTTSYIDQRTPNVGGNVTVGHTNVPHATTPITDNVNGSPRMSKETRPKNVSVNYHIKIR